MFNWGLEVVYVITIGHGDVDPATLNALSPRCWSMTPMNGILPVIVQV